MQMAANRLSCLSLPRSGDLGRGDQLGLTWSCADSFRFHVGHNAEKKSIGEGLTRTLAHRGRVGKITCDPTPPSSVSNRCVE
jgi:hypothetical protein